MNLWMVYTCNMKSSGNLKEFRNFKGIWSIVVTTSKMEEHLSREEESIVWNWKKGKLKTKELLKFSTVVEQESSVQSADRAQTKLYFFHCSI